MFKTGQVYYNPETKSMLLIIDFPKVRIISGPRASSTPFNVSPKFKGKYLVHIGNNYHLKLRKGGIVQNSVKSVAQRQIDSFFLECPREAPGGQEQTVPPKPMREAYREAQVNIRQHEKTIETLKADQQKLEDLVLNAKRTCVDLITNLRAEGYTKARLTELYKDIVSFRPTK